MDQEQKLVQKDPAKDSQTRCQKVWATFTGEPDGKVISVAPVDTRESPEIEINGEKL